MILAVLHGAILTVISYGAIAKHGVGIVARVGFGVGAAGLILLFLRVFMHFFDPHRGLLRHESLL